MKPVIKKFFKIVGTSILLLLVIFFILVLYPIKRLAFPDDDYDVLIIRNTSVIDVKNETVLNHQNIVIRKGLIETVTTDPVTADTTKEKVKVVDGSNKYVIPALWDMHVHLTKRSPHIPYPAFIAHGITHVRDMRGAHKERDPFAGVQSNLEAWNKDVRNYTLLGPRLHGYTSFAIDGPHSMYNGLPEFFNCATSEDAEKLIAYFATKKVTLIKVYNNIPREAFFTLMQRAKTAGIDVAGHKPVLVSTVEAADAGMKSIEHARFFIWDSYSGSEQLRQQVNPSNKVNTALRLKMLEDFDSLILQKNFDAFKRNHTWYCPTHLTRRDEAFAEDENFRARYADINPMLRFLSFEDLDAIIQEDTSSLGRKAFMDFYLKGLEITGKASANGIRILAGSDVPELPGISLHEELTELSKAGLTPFEVLRCATLNAAQYYGLDHQYGTIEKGKIADMVLLSANPLNDIGNTRAVEGVVFDEKYIDGIAINELRIKVKNRSCSLVISAKLLWDMFIYMTL